MAEQQIPAAGVQAISDAHAALVGAITQHNYASTQTAAVHFDTAPTAGTTAHTPPRK